MREKIAFEVGIDLYIFELLFRWLYFLINSLTESNVFLWYIISVDEARRETRHLLSKFVGRIKRFTFQYFFVKATAFLMSWRNLLKKMSSLKLPTI